MPVNSATYAPSALHVNLGPEFFDAVAPARFPQRILRFRNDAWAKRVGLETLTPDEWERAFALFEPLPRNLPQPLALRYHGHQFRHYNADLGDGRGFLYAQAVDAKNGRTLDLGTKGTGVTPWSRRGDGRLTLKGAVREALATEMLEALGVYTSKTFSIYETGESLARGDEPSPTRSAALVRLSHGHVRFGTFQRLAYFRDAGNLEKLLRHAVRAHFPALDADADAPSLAASFLLETTTRTARLAASWMIAGFVHGVLNTDNMNVTGESFDYGPYRFLPTYDPNFTAAYFDETGLYAYGRQPESALWNLQQLAQALLTMTKDPAPLIEALDAFAGAFNAAINEKFLDRLGVASAGAERDEALFLSAFRVLDESRCGFDRFFHDAYGGGERAQTKLIGDAYACAAREEFLAELRVRGAKTAFRSPYFDRSAPCSLLIDEIEAIWDAIVARDDWSPFEEKIAAIRRMREAYGRSDAPDTAP